MSRIISGECEYMDMEWYGIDRQGNIAVFCSGGAANLPEFVCENVERADELMEYFAKADQITSTVLAFGENETERSEQVARDFSDRGLYYFDADDCTRKGICTFQKYYTKRSSPKLPLKYEALPPHIRELLSPNFLDIDSFSAVDRVSVKHAYE